MTHQHQWVTTGKQGVHVEFPTVTKGRKQLYAIYLRCPCGQDGFQRPGNPVVYTWVST